MGTSKRGSAIQQPGSDGSIATLPPARTPEQRINDMMALIAQQSAALQEAQNAIMAATQRALIAESQVKVKSVRPEFAWVSGRIVGKGTATEKSMDGFESNAPAPHEFHGVAWWQNMITLLDKPEIRAAIAAKAIATA